MADLAEFLLARIAEDEAVARAAEGESSYGWTGSAYEEVLELAKNEGAAWSGREHVERHNPARVLAECEAKRRLVERFADRIEISVASSAEKQYVPGAEDTGSLRILALPYADHPDYRQEWRP